MGAVPQLLAATLALAPGESGGNLVGVVPLQVEGEIASDVQSTFDTRVDERLDAAGVSTTDLDDPACTDLACQRTQAKAAGANVLLRVTVAQAQRDYTVRSEIVSVGSGEVLRKDENYCEICTYDEALETLTQQIDNIRSPLQEAIAAEAPGAPLIVTSRPAQAVVRLDGEVVGSTPYRGDVKQGRHELTLNLDGYNEVREPMTVESLEPIALDYRLRHSDRVSVKAAAGWGMVGLSVPMFVSGIVLLAIDENPHRPSCTGASKDVNGTCEFRYNTLGAGVGLTVGGLLVAGGGAALIVLDRKERGLLGGKRIEASAAVGPRGVSVTGRF